MDLSKAKPIEITDKALFDEFFKKYPPEISEFTFTNLFIWRNYYDYLFLEWNDHLLVFSKNYFKMRKSSVSGKSEVVFLLPPIGPTPINLIVKLFNSKKSIEIHRLPHVLTKKLKKTPEYHTPNLVCVDDKDNWDYVYAKKKLISLAGRKLYRKRRWLRRFLENYPDYEFHLLSEEWINACQQLQIEWCDMNECRANEDLIEEQKAIEDAFKYYKELDYRGGLIILDGKCIAYTLGEKLNPDTVVIHIEKAHFDYNGAYQAINNLFMKNCCEDVNYINREQDLGDEGLRHAKRSYYPHHMLKKSILYQTAD